ncbi:hypothetical protein [Leeia aquatica]|uniref:Uncharacterized protein n=1 Tax=Leeia aquatica TaxID=2725557 RepID=A0A847S2Y7_9NEIS|nr:hypothetical protein [Leeia aquatica]NLR74124.1 hypothetical protein [Leeia aquatica]
MKRAVLLLWPSFMLSVVVTGLFFAFFDPQELSIQGQPLELSRMQTYTLAFFGAWFFFAACSWLTLFFERTAEQVDHLPGHDHGNA